MTTPEESVIWAAACAALKTFARFLAAYEELSVNDKERVVRAIEQKRSNNRAGGQS